MDAHEQSQPERQEGDGMTDARNLASHGAHPPDPAPAEDAHNTPPERAEFIPNGAIPVGIVEPPPRHTTKQVDAALTRGLCSLSNPRAKRQAAMAEELAPQLDLFSPKE